MTLKTKTSLLIAFSVVLAVTLSGILFLRQLEGSLRSSILETTRVASTSAAREISLKLHDNLRDTAAIAATLPQAALQRRDLATLQESLRTILALYPEFENGAWILDPTGVMLVDYPPATGVRGRSLNHRDYFQRTLSSGQGVIGTPYVSIRTGEPVLTFTAPLKRADGALLGILACSVKLSSPHALGGIAQQRLGNSGYMYVTAADRTMLLHPDRERILKLAAPPGANALYDAAVAGYDGVGETVNSSGVAMLVSFSHIDEPGWIIAAQQPTAEAFAPVVRARWWLLGALVAGIAVALFAASVVLRRATRNLKRIQQTLTDLARQAQNPHGNGNGLALLSSLERIPPGDEIGALAKSFSTLYRELDRSLNWLRHSTSAWRRTFDAVHEGIVILDREHRLLQFNRAAARMLDIDPNDVSGHRCCGTVHRDNCSPQRCPAVRALEERTEIGGLLSISGEERLLDVVTTPLTDEQGDVIGTMHLLYDLTSQIAAEKRADRLLNFDPLTGLANRNNIRQLLREALSRAGLNHSQTGVLLLNLDHFSEVNESLGHVAGDALIKTAAERLLGQLPTSATAGRLGGDEFIVILHDYEDDTAAATLVHKILTSFGHPFGIAEQVLFCTASIGIARYPQDGLDAASLLKSADIAMYHAKQHGRNTFRFFSSDMSSGALERLRLGTNLRHALDRNEFRLHFQPSVDLESGRVVGFESLLRWNNLEFGEVSPDRFIPLAEENGLIIPIGNWVLQQACSQARRWLDAGLPLERIAVNLSGRQLKQDDLIACVAEVLKKSGLPPSVLELELTETVLMENPAAAASRLAELKALGLHLALDDFGTGYSSLNYLKTFPLDRLKIDRHFVRDLATRPDDASIVEVIIGIARALGMKVTAEGVETPEQLSFLREHQCDEVQGFLFSRALPEHEIPALFARRFNDAPDAEPPHRTGLTGLLS